ncbi:probable serine/threonine-protein kinase SIS8 isoform X1 [Nymphaea colorata]|nr:probable serine/threonine-protein kinase SIS8 isoform X1 [Nymphaea colorata]
MKNLLKRLHIVSEQPDDRDAPEGPALGTSSELSVGGKVSPTRSSPSVLRGEQKALTGFSAWLNSVARESLDSSDGREKGGEDFSGARAVGALSSAADAPDSLPNVESQSSRLMRPLMQEEYQIQLALALSAKEDPEAVQIERVKQISLGSCPPQYTPAEVVAYRYWNYNALDYDDKILDGFYDLYGILAKSTTEKMPSLVDLQGTPVSGVISWEVVLVNREVDTELLKLEQRALTMSLQSRSESHGKVGIDLLQKIAALVSNHMGGPVGDPDGMLASWRALTNQLRLSNSNMVLPLGSLTVGLARHRALLFKVLADAVGISCRLVKGRQHTGSDDVAMNIVKIDDGSCGREYIVDLMGVPGSLIPSDALTAQTECEAAITADDSFPEGVENLNALYTSSGATTSFEGYAQKEVTFCSGECIPSKDEVGRENDLDEPSSGETYGANSMRRQPTSCSGQETDVVLGDFMNPLKEDLESLSSSKQRYPYAHVRSPSWTEGIGSPAARRMKAKDVSQYMVHAAKENPKLAEKLYDVLLESGIVAPSRLFSERPANILEIQLNTDSGWSEDVSEEKDRNGTLNAEQANLGTGYVLPPVPSHGIPSNTVQLRPLEQQNLVEDFGSHLPIDIGETNAAFQVSSQCEESTLPGPILEEKPVFKLKSQIPVAAAAATAAVVASSVVVAAAKSGGNRNIEIPLAAAATATAAALVATTAVVNCQINGEAEASQIKNPHEVAAYLADGGEQGISSAHHEDEAKSNKSIGNEISNAGLVLDDATEFEILWEEVILGERIGLGSYGEVYRGDWHGTEVAVKRFLNQDLSGVALEEFKTEVRIMKRLRHPNVVLFMGAVTRVPNLSIVTEYLPRGSLYRLLHRSNCQIDERRRLRMALDVARGMNYLHKCSPVIVHRDLKSPNLLVDKNWVVKVCDFGLSRIKNSTFLSSRSTSGTAEWMAPEVLRNEPSDERCDIYSFGVILWEITTLQQPWAGMNPMQVVGAVGFQNRRLEIPNGVDSAIAEIITKCWETDPKLRPSFAEIMEALKPLQKPIKESIQVGQQIKKL